MFSTTARAELTLVVDATCRATLRVEAVPTLGVRLMFGAASKAATTLKAVDWRNAGVGALSTACAQVASEAGPALPAAGSTTARTRNRAGVLVLAPVDADVS